MAKKLTFSCLSLGMILYFTPVLRADFSAPSKNISNSALQSKYPKVHWLGAGIPTVFVIWAEANDTNSYLYFSMSTDAGVTWATPYQLTDWGQILSGFETPDAYAFSFVVDNPYIHIVFQHREDINDDFDIYYMGSSDLGANWDRGGWLTQNASDSGHPDIDARGEYVHVVYEDEWPGNREIMYKRITDYGAGTADLTRRLTFSSTYSEYPKIAVSQSGYTLNIVYMDVYSGRFNVFCKYIPASGAGSYSTRQLTFNTTGYNGRADIAFGGNAYEQYVYIVYETDYTTSGSYKDIMYKRLSNWNQPGAITIVAARLTYSTTDSTSCCLDYDNLNNYVHICYHDDWPGNNVVMYRKMTNGGGTGGYTGQRVSWGAGDSVYPTLASHGEWAYVVWSDSSSGNYEIYFKNGN